MRDAGAAVLTRKQGLVVPPDAQKRSRVMARSKFLKINRHMAFSRTYGLITRFLCTACQQPVRLARGDSAVIQTDMANNTVDPRTDRFSMSCSCTIWTVK
jgi:hypothetical protein